MRAAERESPVAISRSQAFLLAMVLLICSAPSQAAPRGNQFLIASDIHFNPAADPAIVAELAATPPQQWDRVLNRSTSTRYSSYGQDTNWLLLQSALNGMRAQLPHPVLVMITGDLLAHNLPQAFAKAAHDNDRDHYRAFVQKTIAFLGWELRQRFKKSQILLTPGNDDSDCGNYDTDAGGPFLTDTKEVARSLARGDKHFLKDWNALGSYALQPRGIRSVRILSVNSVFFSNRYRAAEFAHACNSVNSTAAARTFDWLESRMVEAKQAHQKVWLMLHIPPGIDAYSTMVQYRKMEAAGGATSAALCTKAIVPMWKPEWTVRFEELLEKYDDTIAVTFSGHDHTDDFRLIHAKDPAGQFVLVNPPISPIYGQNPSFRTVTFLDDGELADQATYYLTNARSASLEVPGKWIREYSFIEKWKMARLNAQSLEAVYGQIRSDAEARGQWLTLLNVSSSHDPVPSSGVTGLTCAIASLDSASYEKCACTVIQPSR
jgi:sphingomyelin phosphodiesterase acid-like 3